MRPYPQFDLATSTYLRDGRILNRDSLGPEQAIGLGAVKWMEAGTGIVGTAVAALCCFTPVLVVLLGAVGLSAWLGWLDYVLLPALAFFVALTYAVWRRQRPLNNRTDG